MHASSSTTAVLAGATGLVGTFALRRLLEAPHFNHVMVLARRPLSLTHPRLQTRAVDFQKLDEHGTSGSMSRSWAPSPS